MTIFAENAELFGNLIFGRANKLEKIEV